MIQPDAFTVESEIAHLRISHEPTGIEILIPYSIAERLSENIRQANEEVTGTFEELANKIQEEL